MTPRVRSSRPGFGPMMAALPAVVPDQAIRQAALLAPAEQTVAATFDAEYYLGAYPDVRACGMDPFFHFHHHGTWELRNPNAWFDTGYYVRSNSDVLESGIDPFWHYLVFGKDEGRLPRRPEAAGRAALAAVRPPSAGWVGGVPGDVPHLGLKALRAAIGGRLPAADGFVLSVSHDRYTHSVGGVQILIADEQQAYNRQNVVYLHIAPGAARLKLAPPGTDPVLHLTIDGTHLGLTNAAHLAQVLSDLRPSMPAQRRFVVHCLFGHAIEALVALHAALLPEHAVFWANDYEGICIGFNLLRNDVAFCGGPPQGSMACRVCIYGEERDAHLAEVGRLFAAIPFHVVAPSAAALAVWQDGARLPQQSIQVHPYVRLRPSAIRSGLVSATPRGTPDNPVRIAFVGYAAVHKGWPAFVQLAAALEGHGAYRLVHLTALPQQVPLPGVEAIEASVTAAARGAMTDALIAAAIDLVLVLSPWPETFCLVTYEAMAAGADIVTVPDSGNVADVALETGRGIVVADTAALVEFFASGAAIEYVRMAGDQGSPMGRIESRGMTATLPLPEAAP